MKKKTIILLATVLLIIVAGVVMWHFSSRGSSFNSHYPLSSKLDVKQSQSATSQMGGPSTERTTETEQYLTGFQRDPVVTLSDLPLVEAKLQMPPLAWNRELSARIAGETCEETIQHLGEFDDQHLADTSISGALVTITSPKAQATIVTRLMRVRRLLEEGRKNPAEVSKLLSHAMERAIAEWPQLWQDHQAAMAKAEKAGKAFTRKEANAYDKAHVTVLASTYLLAELEQYGTLPLLLKSSKVRNDRIKMCPPVPPAITLVAMHRLIEKMPDGQLSTAAQEARRTYLAETAKVMPQIEEVQVTGSQAIYQESDPRFIVLDKKKLVLADQPKMRMVVYPYQFRDGTVMSTVESKLSDKTVELFGLIEKFVELAFPER